MQFNVAQLLKEPIGSTRSYVLEKTLIPLEAGGEAWVEGRVLLTRTDSGIWARGGATARVPGACSRCLDAFTQALTLEIEDQYYPTIDSSTGAPLPAPALEEGFPIDAHHILDLQELVRQSVLADLPMKPLCRSECRGLCPQCGAHLNLEVCQCREVRGDSRWRPLLRLLAEGSDPGRRV
jgi:uncharacterized protein